MARRLIALIALLPWLLLACLTATHAEPVLTPEEMEQWLEDDSEQRALEVSEGELVFLPSRPSRRDGRPLPHSHNVLLIDADSLETGWVALEQCHQGLDAVAEAQVVYRYRQMRGLRVVSVAHIGRAWVEGDSIQLQDVQRDARLCIHAQVRVFYSNPDGSFSLVNGPYHRKFLDGYYPYHVTLDVHFPEEQLRYLDMTPAVQPGLAVKKSAGRVVVEAWFEGELNTDIRFQPR
jgi:hypothetical protein